MFTLLCIKICQVVALEWLKTEENYKLLPMLSGLRELLMRGSKSSDLTSL